MAEKIPEPVSDEARWIVRNRVAGIRVEHRQTGNDTAETFVHLTPLNEGVRGVCWNVGTFNAVARLDLGWATVCEPKYGLREKVEAREAWEKTNKDELAEYRRLHAKYGAPLAGPEAGGGEG